MERQQRLSPVPPARPFMNLVAESLRPKDLHLALKTTDHRDALEEILSGLRNDPRVRDWGKLRTSLQSDSGNDTFLENPCAMFLHHSRTESVNGLILAAGRSREGLPIAGREERIHLIFVAAMPAAMNNDYLRILGALARVCREHSSFRELLGAEDPAGFLALLEKGCRQ
jgi:mannitol/fructose-specific phosphotransferase system IIA component (Ntr-type)